MDTKPLWGVKNPINWLSWTLNPTSVCIFISQYINGIVANYYNIVFDVEFGFVTVDSFIITSRQTTLFQRCNVVDVETALYKRQNDVACITWDGPPWSIYIDRCTRALEICYLFITKKNVPTRLKFFWAKISIWCGHFNQLPTLIIF